MIRKLFTAALAALPAFVFAAVSTVTTPGAWDLYAGTTKKASFTDEAACIKGSQSFDVTATYTCRTSTKVSNTKVDVCPNLTGAQATIPTGMVKDAAGNCVLAPSTVTWTNIASEGGTFTLAVLSTVRYGASGSYVQKDLTAGTYSCSNSFFGDPIPGTFKYCDTSSTTPVITAPPPAPAPTGVAWIGVTAAMWSEINAQRAAFGDANDCQARVNAIPASGGVTLSPGADINAALRANQVVFLNGGTYKLSSTISLDAGKKLIGVAGQTVTIDASSVVDGVDIRDNAVLANVLIRDAIDIGVNFYNPSTDGGSSNTLVYQVSVGRTGLPSTLNGNGVGFGVWYSAANNCLVSTEAFDTYNESGPTSTLANGGNADGYRNSYSAHHNTFIDSHSYRNGDDGFDMWEGGVAFMYYSRSFDNGKTTGKTITGDGNGVKLGVGSVSHKLYKVQANTNKANGFDINGNTVQPTLVQSTASGNGGQDYAGVTP